MPRKYHKATNNVLDAAIEEHDTPIPEIGAWIMEFSHTRRKGVALVVCRGCYTEHCATGVRGTDGGRITRSIRVDPNELMENGGTRS